MKASHNHEILSRLAYACFGETPPHAFGRPRDVTSIFVDSGEDRTLSGDPPNIAHALRRRIARFERRRARFEESHALRDEEHALRTRARFRETKSTL